MAENFFVSYDLHAPGKNYEKVVEAIKQQSDGRWARVNLSYWFIKSERTSSNIASAIRAVMDENDSLMVLNADKNEAVWYKLDPEVSTFLKVNWSK